MNKKFLICSAIAMGLLLTACVKKEAPKEDEQVEEAASEAIELQPLEKPTETEAQPQVSQIESSETVYATTVVTRPTLPTEETESVTTAIQDKPTTLGVESPKPSTSRSKESQSEDDAVAAAIAAATPALEK